MPEKRDGSLIKDSLFSAARSSPAALHQVYPATALSVRAIRSALGQFTRALGLPTEMRDNVMLAASEAATNVVVHAYTDQDEPGTIEVDATIAGDELWLIIADTGLGLRPRVDSPGLGLGLAIIARLADGVDLVRPAAGGVELRMRFALSEEAAGVSGEAAG